jgi:alpha-aminoadipic semialdehyde synthase
MAVDILPTEFPRDASTGFSRALLDMLPALAESDPSVRFEDWVLPAPLKRAVIVHQGVLTRRFTYLEQHVS